MPRFTSKILRIFRSLFGSSNDRSVLGADEDQEETSSTEEAVDKEEYESLKEKNKGLNEELDRWIRGCEDVGVVKKDFMWVINRIDQKYSRVTSLDVKAYDRTALLVDKGDAQSIVEEDLTNTLDYVADSDSFVCNHFAFVLSSLVKLKYHVDVGVVLSLAGEHAYNVFVFPDGSVHTFEPQENLWDPSGKRFRTNHEDTVIIFP